MELERDDWSQKVDGLLIHNQIPGEELLLVFKISHRILFFLRSNEITSMKILTSEKLVKCLRKCFTNSRDKFSSNTPGTNIKYFLHYLNILLSVAAAEEIKMSKTEIITVIVLISYLI